MNENNNADFEETVGEVHPTLRPAPNMTLEQFVDIATNLLEGMQEDYFEQTGDEDSHAWDYWTEQLTNAYVND